MVELVFFSSNRGKLANFKHIGDQFGIAVKGFREKFFYASYHEPRLDDRETLLRESYESALAQWKRRYPHDDHGFFFLEDTSVRLEALSGVDDFPGVHVKYWMKDMNFQKLDRLIRENGGNRSVTVRSDIVLHIPERFRTVLGVGSRLMWFCGQTEGFVIEDEMTIKPNLLYPWLDDKTFNRWFVPQGFDQPISCLPIQQADSVDFRRQAFLQVAHFLQKARILPEAANHESLQLPLSTVPKAPPIFVICGYSCAGKTTLAQWMRDKYGYAHLEASDFMYQAFWRRHGISSDISIADFAESALSQDPTIVPKAIAEQIRDKDYAKVVVSGFRSPGEIEELKRIFSQIRDVELVFLEASSSLRLARAIDRGREKINAASLRKRDLRENAMGLLRIKKMKGCLLLFNETTKPSLFNRFRTQFKPMLERECVPRMMRERDRERELEDLILLSLYSDRKHNEAYTTREIADLVNRVCHVSKSKNNVSRYFNQDFHAYYEACVLSRKIRYRLSNTGLSRAVYLMRSGTTHISRRSPTKSTIETYSLFPDT